MSTTDIIPGMTEVMDYIKKQDEEIKKLKEEKESLTFIMKGQDDVRRECIKGYTEQNEKLKEEKDGYFQAWLYYWSGGKQGKEHMIPMSEIEDGKYQKILEDEDDT